MQLLCNTVHRQQDRIMSCYMPVSFEAPETPSNSLIRQICQQPTLSAHQIAVPSCCKTKSCQLASKIPHKALTCTSKATLKAMYNGYCFLQEMCCQSDYLIEPLANQCESTQNHPHRLHRVTVQAHSCWHQPQGCTQVIQ